MIRRTTISTQTDTLFPNTRLLRSLHIRAAPQGGTLVELHGDDPRIGHAVAYRRAGEGNQSVPHNPQRERLILALRAGPIGLERWAWPPSLSLIRRPPPKAPRCRRTSRPRPRCSAR